MNKKTLELKPHNSDEMIKPSELIEIRGTGHLTLQDRRVFNALVENAFGPDLGIAGKWFSISTGELKDATHRNTRLTDSIERLMRTICLVALKDGREMRLAMLGTNKLTPTENRGILEYTFPVDFAELLKNSTIFAKLDLAVMKSFSSKYAFALYESVSRRINQRWKYMETLTLEELRNILGVEEGKHTSYKNLNKVAIQPALTEVNAITPYQVSITPQKQGRAIGSVILGWNYKDEGGMKAAFKELNASKTGRKARLENKGETVVEGG
jgi:hypothetical protein